MDRMVRGMHGILDDLLTAGLQRVLRVGTHPGGYGAMGPAAIGGAATTVLELLFASRGGGKGDGQAAGIAPGGLSALGRLAWDSWWKRAGTPGDEPAIQDLTGEAADRRATGIAVALIAAAKCGGHIDAAQRAAIERHLAGLPEAVRAALAAELIRPLDVSDVARHADSEQAARELYAVSAMICGDDDPHGREWLAVLATMLRLPTPVREEIEAELRSAR